MHQIRHSVPLSNGRFTSLHQVHGYPILPSSRLSSPSTIFEQIRWSIGFLEFLSQLQQSEQLIENSKLPTAEANTNATSVIKPLQIVHWTLPLFATTADRFLLDSWNIIA